MRLNLLAGIAAGVIVAASSFGAQAAEFLFTYTSFGGAPLSAHFDVVTDNVFDSDGNLTVTGVSGDVAGDSISGLLAAGLPAPGGLWNIDNKLRISFDFSHPWFDNYGLGLMTVGGKLANLYSADVAVPPAVGGPGNSYSLGTSVGCCFSDSSNGSLSVREIAGVPEPAAWALMIMGFGGIGASLRSKRRFAGINDQTTAAAA